MVANALFGPFGQSNAIGICVAADVNNFAGFTTPVSAIQMFNYYGKGGDPPTAIVRDPVSGTRDLAPRLIGGGDPFNPGTCGTEVSMLKTLHADSSLVGRVRGVAFGLDGSSLDLWQPSSTFPTGSPDNWFTTCVKKIKDAQTLTNSSIRLGGISWLQGTSDALSSSLANAYYSNLDTFFKGLWNAFGCKFNVVIDRISQGYINNYPGAAANGPTVRAALVQWAGDNGMPWVDTDDLTTFPPGGSFPTYNPHYDSNSISTLGVRHAQAHLARRQRMDTRR